MISNPDFSLVLDKVENTISRPYFSPNFEIPYWKSSFPIHLQILCPHTSHPPPSPPPPLHTHTHTPPLPINESSWHKLFHSCFSVKSFWEVPYSEIMSSTQSPFIVVATMVAIMSKMWRTVHIMIYNILKVYHWVIMCLVLQNLNFHTWVFQTFIICPYVVKWYSS